MSVGEEGGQEDAMRKTGIGILLIVAVLVGGVVAPRQARDLAS
jgi:hypothetical protein